MILSLEVTTLNQASESSLRNENVPLFLELVFCGLRQKLIFVILEGRQPTIGTLVLDLFNMFGANYLCTLHTAQWVNAPFITYDTRVASRKRKICWRKILELRQGDL